MKKMTIALLTAAAMGGSSLAIAADVTGPTLFGRLDVRATSYDDANLSGDNEENQDIDFDSASQHIGATGSVTGLPGGMDASYYTRYGKGGTLEYGTITVNGGFGSVTAGVTDDLVYQMVGVYVDKPRIGATAAFAGQVGNGLGEQPSLKYYNDFGTPVTLGVQIDSGDNATNAASDSGIENTQVGLSVDAGMATLAAVYGEQDAADTDVMYVGGTFDLGVATLNAYVGSDETDADTYTVGADIPLNDVFTGYVYYGDDDTDADTSLELRANLGGGLDAYVGTKAGDSNDVTYLGTRWGF